MLMFIVLGLMSIIEEFEQRVHKMVGNPTVIPVVVSFHTNICNIP